MGILIFLIIIGIFVAFIYVNVKIQNLKGRAIKQVFRNNGVSFNLNEEISKGFEKSGLKKFLEDNSTFTEESIKEILQQYINKIIEKNSISEFSEGVCQKMQNDSKIEKLKNMQFVRVNITQYNSNTKKLVGNVVYTDNRDEYNVFLICNVMGEKIKLENYRINKGEELGL